MTTKRTKRELTERVLARKRMSMVMKTAAGMMAADMLGMSGTAMMITGSAILVLQMEPVERIDNLG